MTNSIPEHIAVIMDGNSRWATSKNLSTKEGHKAGAEAAKLIIEEAAKNNVKYLTLYAFSSENWSRPEEEIESIKILLEYYLYTEAESLVSKGVKLNFIGNYKAFGEKISLRCDELVELSKSNELISVNIALNYGSKLDIIEVANKVIDTGERLTLKSFEGELYEGSFPDPDLLVRTGGEKRISNFLLWQLAYAELYFTDVLWPDFDSVELLKSISDFSSRERRYGGR